MSMSFQVIAVAQPAILLRRPESENLENLENLWFSSAHGIRQIGRTRFLYERTLCFTPESFGHAFLPGHGGTRHQGEHQNNSISHWPWNLEMIYSCSPTAWRAWGSSNKASGWFGAATRNLEPGSPRFHTKVPLLKFRFPKVPQRFHS